MLYNMTIYVENIAEHTRIMDLMETNVSNGAKLLDSLFPDGWVDRINIDEIDMTSVHYCILAQVYLDEFYDFINDHYVVYYDPREKEFSHLDEDVIEDQDDHPFRYATEKIWPKQQSVANINDMNALIFHHGFAAEALNDYRTWNTWNRKVDSDYNKYYSPMGVEIYLKYFWVQEINARREEQYEMDLVEEIMSLYRPMW